MCRFIQVTILCLAFPSLLWGASYYVDPVNGNRDNPGTMEKPWRTLEEVLAQKKTFAGGDTIFLRSGYHGAIVLTGENDHYVTIQGLSGEHPTVSRIQIRKARFWRIGRMEISPEHAKIYSRQTLVDVAEQASDIAIEHCTLFSERDSSGWSADDWVQKSCFGLVVDGTRIRVAGNHLLNVDHGISIVGRQNIVENNTIENFSGDGIRALGDHCVYRYNVIKNCYDVDDNHDDGIQSWSVGPNGVGTGTVRDVVIEGNLIINHSDPGQKYKGTLQGVGCFDGFYENWVIANNVVIVDHWHGITLGGARNCKIINNTVVDINNQRPGPPWILIDRHKNGTPSSGNLIRNNLAKAFPSKPEVGHMDHNLVITAYDDFFETYGKFDLRLKAACPARDAGSNEGITAKDFLRHDRLIGNTVDIGAIEFVPEKASDP
ncbi:MAG: right-handed parallel beta-helix repeat-containing protein [Sedimentisphaerales bacterium]|nr:right-handed parallel beta-helix repeat-containing protein [Sedimentisphaerales bacterium]